MAMPITLITGASSGIGAALTRVFAANGHHLVMVARRAEELTALADSIAAVGHPRPRVLPLDLATPDAGDRLERRLAEHGCEPAFVVSSAGFGLLGPAALLDRRAQLAMIDLNVRALTDVALRFLPSIERNRGGILNVASVAAFMPRAHMAVYHATKAYVLSFSVALGQELKPKGVRVTALCPGPVPTEFFRRAGLTRDQFPRALHRSAERVAHDGYAGLMRGERVVVPGFPNKVLAALPRVLQRSAVLAWFGATAREAKPDNS